MPRWVPARTRSVLLSCLSCLAALAVAGCAGGATARTSQVVVSGSTLAVYAGQPPGGSGGSQAADTLDAEQLALQQAGGKAGKFTVKLIKLDGREVSANARTAIEDQRSIAYLGELQPGTSQISVEILNQQGVLEISPADTAVYLTQPVPPVSNSVDSFFPAHSTYHETFARVVPNSASEARALMAEMQAEHVSRLYVASDGSQYGRALGLEVSSDAKGAGLTAASSAAGADGVFYAASASSAGTRTAAAHALDQAATASPSAKLFAPSGLYDSSFVSGLNGAAQQRLVVTSPGFLPRDLPPAGKTFESAFNSAYGHAPAPQAIFGYEAMSALLAVLDQLGARASDRADVVSAFRSLKNRNSAIGTYSISGGDPSIAPFVFAHVRGGQLVPFKSVQG